jgi:diaminopimelate epimerase
MPMTFAKVHSAGSDHIVVNQAQSTPADLPSVARRFCPQRAGVGAIGLAVFAHQGYSRFVIRYFGPDGKEFRADGNALRCCARVINLQYGYRTAALITEGGVHDFDVLGDNVGVCFPSPGDLTGPFVAQRRRLYGIRTGGDNIVMFTEDVDSIDLGTQESVIRNSSSAAMSSARINFVEIFGAASLRLRTFDCTVGAEAMSNDNGALAAAVVARRIGLCRQENIEVQTGSGCSLTVPADCGPGESSWLYGPASFCFSGELPALASRPAPVIQPCHACLTIWPRIRGRNDATTKLPDRCQR